MNTFTNWMNSATAWMAANPVDVVYIAAILAGLALASSGSRR
jgi:hypothetical protein